MSKCVNFNLMQEVKKEIKSLEALNEKLDFIQKTWQSQGMEGDITKQLIGLLWVRASFLPHLSFPVEQHVGLAQSSAAVEEECLKWVNFITQTKKVLSMHVWWAVVYTQTDKSVSLKHFMFKHFQV